VEPEAELVVLTAQLQMPPGLTVDPLALMAERVELMADPVEQMVGATPCVALSEEPREQMVLMHPPLLRDPAPLVVTLLIQVRRSDW
jgi:hypothetical protein